MIWILTIDVSNLNRQLLFQKKHVGRSKAQVAKESVLQFYPKASIIAYHDSIMKDQGKLPAKPSMWEGDSGLGPWVRDRVG